MLVSGKKEMMIHCIHGVSWTALGGLGNLFPSKILDSPVSNRILPTI